MRKIPLSNKQKEYLRKVHRRLHSKVTSPFLTISDFITIQYKVEMEFINRVLGDLYYRESDKSRLNELKKLYVSSKS
jgi:hypothetical protein